MLEGASVVENSDTELLAAVAPASKKPKLIASYQCIRKHRASFEADMRKRIASLRETVKRRAEIAEGCLDELLECFGQNGYDNQYDRVVFAHLMLDCLYPIMFRCDGTLDEIEKVFYARGQAIPLFLGNRMRGLRRVQSEYRAKQKGEASELPS